MTTHLGTPYAYDKLFDRRFMNCGERHAVVFLGQAGRPVDLLFHAAWMPLCDIFNHVVTERRPKNDFPGPFMADEDLAAIGVVRHVAERDAFEAALDIVRERLPGDGFVLLSGDVFYFEHCPEFRNRHSAHIVVVRAIDAGERWDIVDDDPASVLKGYAYPQAQVRAFFENNVDRKIRWFDRDDGVTAEMAAERMRARFEAHFATVLAAAERDQAFAADVRDFAASRFDAVKTRYHLLHEVFAFLSGSRALFGRYARVAGLPDGVADLAEAVGREAFVLKSLFQRAILQSRIDDAELARRLGNLSDAEQRLRDAVVTAMASAGSPRTHRAAS